MAEARGRFDWAQTAELLSMLYNAHRDPNRTGARSAADFSPFPEAPQRPTPKTKDLSILKTVFVDR
jgi:hypothetical protein